MRQDELLCLAMIFLTVGLYILPPLTGLAGITRRRADGIDTTVNYNTESSSRRKVKKSIVGLILIAIGALIIAYRIFLGY